MNINNKDEDEEIIKKAESILEKRKLLEKEARKKQRIIDKKLAKEHIIEQCRKEHEYREKRSSRISDNLIQMKKERELIQPTITILEAEINQLETLLLNKKNDLDKIIRDLQLKCVCNELNYDESYHTVYDNGKKKACIYCSRERQSDNYPCC